MNFLKIDQLSIGGPIGVANPILFSENFLFRIIKVVNLSQHTRELTIKFLSGRLNIRLYNKLSKEVGDFKDLEDEYIYTQH